MKKLLSDKPLVAGLLVWAAVFTMVLGPMFPTANIAYAMQGSEKHYSGVPAEGHSKLVVETAPVVHHMFVVDFTTGKVVQTNITPEAVEDIERFESLPEPALIQNGSNPDGLPYYRFSRLPLEPTWVVNKSSLPWVWIEPTNWYGLDGRLFASWRIGTDGAGEVFRVSDSPLEGYYQVSWTDRVLGKARVVQLPQSNVLKISTCDEVSGTEMLPVTYIQVGQDGMLSFMATSSVPLFSLHSITCQGGVEYLGWDTYFAMIP